MREFKFRAWDKINQRMTSTNISIDFINNMCHLFDEEFKGNPSFINEFIPLQYSGLKDKNGKEIYEGDILMAPYMNGKPCKVIYSEELAKFTMDGRFNFTVIDKNLEIIGNIYENKELLDA